MTQQRTRDILRQWHQSGLTKSAMIVQLEAEFRTGAIPNDSQIAHDAYVRRYVAEGFMPSKKTWISDPPTGKPRK